MASERPRTMEELGEMLLDAYDVLGNILSLGCLNAVQHGITKPRAEALFQAMADWQMRDEPAATAPTQADEERASRWLDEYMRMGGADILVRALASEFAAARNEGAEAEREACAAVCDEAVALAEEEHDAYVGRAAEVLAERIRARSRP